MGFSWSTAAVLLTAFPFLVLSSCGDDEEEAAPVKDAGRDTAPEEVPAPKTSEAGAGVVIIEVDCPPGASPEIGDNNTAATANELTELSFCGAITPGEDVDYSKFTTPQGKKLTVFQAVIDGKVDFDLVVNGTTLKPTDVKKFESGEYVVKAYTTDKKPGKYKYRIQFEP